jgi:hypothetical protein
MRLYMMIGFVQSCGYRARLDLAQWSLAVRRAPRHARRNVFWRRASCAHLNAPPSRTIAPASAHANRGCTLLIYNFIGS